MIKVRVLFFGQLKDLAGAPDTTVELPVGARLADLLAQCEARIPGLQRFSGAMAMSINQEYASPEAELRADDEVALLPPVSGGAPRCALVRERIETAALVAEMKRGEDGATVVFEGMVRNNTRGRRTLYLDYEAYEAMALKQMEALTDEALRLYPVRDAAILHRLGRIEIGETSVLIVVTSAHRGAAFDAGRWLIDTLKRTVPIWKKEYFEDGAVWADGEPFPEGISRAQATPAAPAASE
jgi:molybdopterin synthase catalytic subunit